MLTRLLHKLLYYNGIKIDSLLISSIFKGHPIQHSMRAISDTLDSLGVSNIVCRLNFEELMEIKKPCLVVLGDDEYPFYILKNFDATKKEIRVVSVYNKSFTIKTHIFTSLWNNTVLCIADNEDEVESFSFLYYVRQLLWNLDYYAWSCMIILSLLMSILYGFYADIDISQILLKNIGIVISAIIVSGTDKIKSVCRRNGGNSCSIIFNERFRVFQWISLGELSLAYFISSLLALLLFPESLMFVFIGMFNMLVVLFSVVYQILHKNFCLFCMSLNIILVIEFFMKY